MRLQRRKEKDEKERVTRIEYELRIELEHRKKNEAEGLIDALEREEKEIIDRLKIAQDLQLKVYDIFQNSSFINCTP